MHTFDEYKDDLKESQMLRITNDDTLQIVTDLELIRILNETIRSHKIFTLFPYVSNSLYTSSDDTRMTFNQITFAVLISILFVADMMLVWSLAHIVILYERRGQLLLEHHYAMLGHYSHSSNRQHSSV